jgi:hypothetical protein
MPFRFAVDKITKGRAYPALTQWQARPYTQAWREFGSHWPWTTPLRIEEYCREHAVPVELYTLDQFPDRSWYPICLGFFDFDIDYLSLLPESCVTALRCQRLRLLFMYHEGDNPARIKQRLDSLCQQHQLDPACYVFVSSNTMADRLPRFVSFQDFELWYHQRNIKIDPLPVGVDRSRDFLCLNRIHKNWRAAVVADLTAMGVLDNSIWSYCAVGMNDDQDNPLQIDLVPQLRYNTGRFLSRAPYFADDFTNDERNDHSMISPKLYQDSFCNIVTESQLDVDQSGGVFLTEKTFKPIKHAQMFFVVGAAGSLAVLRSMGYRVFDHVLDNSYDAIEDPTQRWLALRDAIQQAHQQGVRDLYVRCQSDIEHNQRLFLSVAPQRLNSLAKRLDAISW